MPFAIGPKDLHPRSHSRWRSVAAFVILGGILVAALSGFLGGGASRNVLASGSAVSADLTYDPIVRSGNWYETQVTVHAEAPIQDLTIAISQPLWSRMSIDTLAPDAESSEALDGRYTYHFGEMKPGERFRLKIDGQIQPGMPRLQSGTIDVRDDTRVLASIPYDLTVLP